MVKRKHGFVYEPDVVGALFRQYKRAMKLTNGQLGEMTGQSAKAVSEEFRRGTWDVKSIKLYAKALNIPADELGKAILY